MWCLATVAGAAGPERAEIRALGGLGGEGYIGDQQAPLPWPSTQIVEAGAKVLILD